MDGKLIYVCVCNNWLADVLANVSNKTSWMSDCFIDSY